MRAWAILQARQVRGQLVFPAPNPQPSQLCAETVGSFSVVPLRCSCFGYWKLRLLLCKLCYFVVVALAACAAAISASFFFCSISFCILPPWRWNFLVGENSP